MKENPQRWRCGEGLVHEASSYVFMGTKYYHSFSLCGEGRRWDEDPEETFDEVTCLGCLAAPRKAA